MTTKTTKKLIEFLSQALELLNDDSGQAADEHLKKASNLEDLPTDIREAIEYAQGHISSQDLVEAASSVDLVLKNLGIDTTPLNVSDTPWHIYEDEGEFNILDPDDDYVARMLGRNRAGNAELLIKAISEHAELTEILRIVKSLSKEQWFINADTSTVRHLFKSLKNLQKNQQPNA